MTNYPDYEIEKLNTFYQLYQRMKRYPDRIAAVEGERQISYGQLCSDIRNAAGAFGFQRKFVLVNCKSKYSFTVAYFAIVLSGNIACLQHYAPQIAPCYAGFDFAATADDDFILSVAQTPAGEIVGENTDENEICTTLSSSGTTAKPKVIALSQKNIISDMIAGMEKYAFPDYGRYVSVLPYSHAFGLVCDLLAPLYSFSTLYFVYDVIAFFAALPRFNPTALNITPSLVEALSLRLSSVGDKSKTVGDSLVKILSGGADTSAKITAGMRQFGIEVYGCYGLSECAPCVCVNRDGYYKDGSAGVALNCNHLRVDEEGCITVEGTNVMQGYLDESGNLSQPADSVFRTGDLGYIDEDGFLYVLGRTDDLIVLKSGIKIVPQSIEKEINRLAAVVESLVYLQGDSLAATVVLAGAENESAVRKVILESNYGEQKITRLYFTDQPLVRNALGKVERKKYGD